MPGSISSKPLTPEALDALAYDGPLGASYAKERTVFRVWSPGAEAVRVRLFDTVPPRTVPLTRADGGRVWEATVTGDLDGVYYTYVLTHDGKETETPDIWADACGLNGQRSMVLDLSRTDPPGWDETRPVRLAHPVDAVIWEVHVRDFSMDEAAGFVHRGKLLAFGETGVTNTAGDLVGMDYLASLGVTHIHLLPVTDFASVDEAAPTYNWGYDPQHYRIPEGSYATDPEDGAVRIRELKALVAAAHRRGIGVVLDVVFNHTFLRAESAFEATVPGYFYRRDEDGWANGSGCGNEIATERIMMRRHIVDAVCHLARTYRVDGFRFDLMGLIDIETMNECARTLRQIDPDILLYGEGWTGGLSPLSEERRAVKGNTRQLDGIACFSDDFRDTAKGSVFLDTAQGFVNGAADADCIRAMQEAFCGGVLREDAWADAPGQVVNYLACHDDLTLHDKLVLSMPDADPERIARAERMAAALLLLAQGTPFLMAGQEMMRSKPLPDGSFDHNSYRSPDSVNAIRWDGLTAHRGLVAYYRGLIALRRRFAVFRLRDAEAIREAVTFPEAPEGVFAAKVGAFTILMTPGGTPYPTALHGAVYADSEHASDRPLYPIDGAVTVPPYSVLILREDR